MLVSMLALEARSSCYLFTRSWSKAEFSTGRLTTVNFIRYPVSSIQLRYQLRQRQTGFCTCSFLALNLIPSLTIFDFRVVGISCVCLAHLVKFSFDFNKRLLQNCRLGILWKEKNVVLFFSFQTVSSCTINSYRII